jgi:hypothetical protein
MKINNYLQLLIAILLIIAYRSLQSSDDSINHLPVAYSQNQSSSFQAAVKALDDIPARKVKVGDIDMSLNSLGIILTNRLF